MSNSFNNQNNGNNKTTTPNGGPPFAAHLKADGPEPPSVRDAALDGTAEQPGATPSAVPPGLEPPLLAYASFSGMAQQPSFASPPGLPLLQTNGPKPFSVPYASYCGDTAQQEPDENAPPAVAGTSSTYLQPCLVAEGHLACCVTHRLACLLFSFLSSAVGKCWHACGRARGAGQESDNRKCGAQGREQCQPCTLPCGSSPCR